MSALSSSLDIQEIQQEGYEKIVFARDKQSGLQAIIAIHDTRLGPALGGTRIFSYETLEQALTDVLRLSKGMTYKSALAEVGLGGGKSVIIADPKKEKRDILLRFGELVDSLKGLYICAEDVGCTTQDVAIIRKKTPYVVGLEEEKSSGDPSHYTAWGTFLGLKESWTQLTENKSLVGVKVLIQGLGAVGEKLAEALFWEGAHLFVSDLDSNKVMRLVKKYGAEPVAIEEVYKTECDIFSPCAMGGILNEDSISQLKCQLVAGCANNQILKIEDDRRLREKGILYAPDFVINAGGLINVAQELEESGYHPKRAQQAVAKIPKRLKEIYNLANKKQIGTQAAAILLAEEKLEGLVQKRTAGPYFHIG